MENGTDKNTAQNESDQYRRIDFPFDATTNFSIIGWLLDKIRKSERPAEHVDLSL